MKRLFPNFNKHSVDDWIVLLSTTYVILPILIFLLCFAKPIIFVIGLVFFGLLFKQTINESLNKSNGFTNNELFASDSKKFFIISFIILFFWIFFSGIGGFSYQNWDFWVRNPIYNDLCQREWPIYYDLSIQGSDVTSLIGSDFVAFDYYFTYWLIPASISKILHLPQKGCEVVLFLYSLIGILIVFYLLVRLFKKFSLKITLIFISFSGLDVIETLIAKHEFPYIMDDIEWSLRFFQLSGNTTQIYYVFNQSIPIWILLLLILNIESPKILIGLSAISFAYSPWATIGLVPIVIVAILYRNNNTLASQIKKNISLVNILIPVFMLVIFGLFYSASGSANGGHGFYGKAMGADTKEYIFLFILYVLFEFGLFYLAMGRSVFNYKFALLVFLELALFPIYYFIDFNFFIRGTMAALFLLMLIIISFVIDVTPSSIKKPKASITIKPSVLSIRKRILTILLCLGAYTSLFTFSRGVILTCRGGEFTNTTIKTFDNMTGIDEYYIGMSNSQFFVHDFESKPFYKYIAK